MKFFFPHTLFHELPADKCLKYIEFYSFHATTKLIDIGLLKPEAKIINTYNSSKEKISLKISHEQDYTVAETMPLDHSDLHVHVSDSVWGTWWHNASYPTLSSDLRPYPSILMLPITFSMGFLNLDFLCKRLKTIENPLLNCQESIISNTSLTAANTYTSNRIASYSFDIASKLSYEGFRFRNNDFIRASKRDRNSTTLICIIGGSAAFCDCSPDSLSFPYLLEKFLGYLKPERKFTVLNFGQIGSTLSTHLSILADCINFLEPDILISYTGYNEIRNLLSQPSSIKFAPGSIPHAHTLHINKEFYNAAPDKETENHRLMATSAHSILKAITTNHQNINAICLQAGIRYIAITQLISYWQRSKMSNLERGVLDFYSQDPNLKISYEKISFLLPKIYGLLNAHGIESHDLNTDSFIGLNRSSMTALESYFHDTMHQTFNCEPYIAAQMTRIILNQTSTKANEATIKLHEYIDSLGYPFKVEI